MTIITLVGAGGKMGCRLTDNFVKSRYKVSYLEVSPRGLENLKQRGVTPSDQITAVPQSDVVILAVPDVAIGAVAREVVPLMTPGADYLFASERSTVRFSTSSCMSADFGVSRQPG